MELSTPKTERKISFPSVFGVDTSISTKILQLFLTILFERF